MTQKTSKTVHAVRFNKNKLILENASIVDLPALVGKKESKYHKKAPLLELSAENWPDF